MLGEELKLVVQPGMLAETGLQKKNRSCKHSKKKESLTLSAMTLGSATMFVTPNFHVSGSKISSQTQPGYP